MASAPHKKPELGIRALAIKARDLLLRGDGHGAMATGANPWAIVEGLPLAFHALKFSPNKNLTTPGNLAFLRHALSVAADPAKPCPKEFGRRNILSFYLDISTHHDQDVLRAILPFVDPGIPSGPYGRSPLSDLVLHGRIDLVELAVPFVKSLPCAPTELLLSISNFASRKHAGIWSKADLEEKTSIVSLVDSLMDRLGLPVDPGPNRVPPLNLILSSGCSRLTSLALSSPRLSFVTGDSRGTAAHSAAQAIGDDDFPSLVGILIEAGVVDPDHQNPITGNLPIHAAAEMGNRSLCSLFAMRNDPSARNKRGLSPFFCSCDGIIRASLAGREIHDGLVLCAIDLLPHHDFSVPPKGIRRSTPSGADTIRDLLPSHPVLAPLVAAIDASLLDGSVTTKPPSKPSGAKAV